MTYQQIKNQILKFFPDDKLRLELDVPATILFMEDQLLVASDISEAIYSFDLSVDQETYSLPAGISSLKEITIKDSDNRQYEMEELTVNESMRYNPTYTTVAEQRLLGKFAYAILQNSGRFFLIIKPKEALEGLVCTILYTTLALVEQNSVGGVTKFTDLYSGTVTDIPDETNEEGLAIPYGVTFESTNVWFDLRDDNGNTVAFTVISRTESSINVVVAGGLVSGTWFARGTGAVSLSSEVLDLGLSPRLPSQFHVYIINGAVSYLAGIAMASVNDTEPNMAIAKQRKFQAIINNHRQEFEIGKQKVQVFSANKRAKPPVSMPVTLWDSPEDYVQGR